MLNDLQRRRSQLERQLERLEALTRDAPEAKRKRAREQARRQSAMVSANTSASAMASEGMAAARRRHSGRGEDERREAVYTVVSYVSLMLYVSHNGGYRAATCEDDNSIAALPTDGSTDG